MAHASIFLVTLFMSFFGKSPASEPTTLEANVVSNRWKHRVILVYAQTNGAADLQKQRKLLAEQQKGLAERDFELIIAVGADLSAADKQYLRGGDRQLPASARFMTYLIGKDGGVKQRFATPVGPAELFRIVDSMPMRQSEMRRQGE
ncbi:DUF4174 domain-containing protein [Fibrella sp. ES10-3-2-2]